MVSCLLSEMMLRPSWRCGTIIETEGETVAVKVERGAQLLDEEEIKLEEFLLYLKLQKELK
jgi:hypothetical protein